LGVCAALCSGLKMFVNGLERKTNTATVQKNLKKTKRLVQEFDGRQNLKLERAKMWIR
jgi:hypothetical protein